MSGILRIQRPVALLNYSGPKSRYATEYQTLQQERLTGTITPVAFRQAIGQLNQKQKKYDVATAKRASKRQELRMAQEEFEKVVAREEKKMAKREKDMIKLEKLQRAKMLFTMKQLKEEKAEDARFRDTVVYDETHTGITFSEQEIYQASQRLAGNNEAYVSISRNGVIVFNQLVQITDKAKEIYFRNIKHIIFPYDEDIFATRDGETRPPTVRIVLSRSQEVPPKRISQSFREGEKHCVLEPLYQLFMEYWANSESVASKKRYFTIANRMKRLMEEYDQGVPEDKMEEVAKSAYRCIVIYDVLGNETFRYNKSSTKMFHFTNTRENHLEQGHLTMDKQYTSVSQEELNKLMLEHDTNKEFYLFRGDFSKKIPQSLRSNRGAWAVYNEDYEIFQEFNKTVGIQNYRINAIKYPCVNNFIKDGRIIHAGAVALCKSPNRMDGVSHYDMKKAYTQHSVSKYFSGFLGHVQQWAMLTGKGLDFVRDHLGMFRFKVLTTTDLLRKLGMRSYTEYTLPGPELLYMCDVLGLEVELVAGLWGSRAEINYTPEMLTNRRYCTWAGKLGMESQNDVYMFKGSYDWACHLKSELGEDRVAFWGDFICVKNPKKSMPTTHHLLAFITSYSRINMLEMMRRVDGELVKVVLDGLYFRGTMDTEGLDIEFSENKQRIAHNGFTTWYNSSTTFLDWEEYSSVFDGSCVLAGAGGTGKSYNVFNDKSIYQPLYVVPSNMLGRKVRAEYGVSYTTIHKLIGIECRPYGDENGHPHNIFIDELTMIDKEWIQKALKMYPQSRFYIAGDIDGKQWYQCRNGGAGDYSEIWIPSREEWRYVDFTVDMRSKDEELKTFKSQVRDVMRGVFTDGGMNDAHRINDIVRASVKTISFGDATKMFMAGDIWIAGTHKTNNRLLDAGIVSGYVNARKEIIDATEGQTGEARGAFTVHSFQGLTIPNKKVFVSLDMFEYAMFYTAISRVCHFNQLVIVS
jgi:hypothetical protein